MIYEEGHEDKESYKCAVEVEGLTKLRLSLVKGPCSSILETWMEPTVKYIKT